jgi:hypothetical protein
MPNFSCQIFYDKFSVFHVKHYSNRFIFETDSLIEMAVATDNRSLRTLFKSLMISEDIAENYASELLEIGIQDEKDLRKFVNVWSLKKIGVRSTDIQHIMQRLFDTTERERTQQQENFLIDVSGIHSVPRSLYDITSPYVRRFTRDVVINLGEIGHGATGCVSKALFLLTLTFLAIKSIEIKEAITRKVVGQELKFLYEIARSNCVGPSFGTPLEKSDPEAPLDSILSNSESALPQTSNIPANSPVVRPANSPYIIGFHDAYIDPEHGAVCLVLEYMNGGSIQRTISSGEKYDENSVAVLAFSVLSALVELHSRNILHRDIKPSNILADFNGRIKLTDFGITKGNLVQHFL